MEVDLSGMGFEDGARGAVAGGDLVVTREGAATDRLPVVVAAGELYLQGHEPGGSPEATCAHGKEQWQCGAHLAALPLRALAVLLLAVALPALAGDPPRPPRPGDEPAAVEFCRAKPNGSGQVPDKSCPGGTRHVDCDGDLPGLTYCGEPISG